MMDDDEDEDEDTNGVTGCFWLLVLVCVMLLAIGLIIYWAVAS